MLIQSNNIYLTASVKRSLKICLQTLNAQYHDTKSCYHFLGHPYDYTTIKDLSRAKEISNKLASPKALTIEELLGHQKRLSKIITRRYPQIFNLFSNNPNLVKDMIEQTIKILDQDSAAASPFE
jgi:hypothetical protein